MLLLVLTGTGISYNFGVDRWFVAAVPDALLGQAMTVMQAGRMTVMGSAMGLAGAAAEYAPLRVVMPAAGVLGAVCVLAVIREVRRTAQGRPGGTVRAAAGAVRDPSGSVRDPSGPARDPSGPVRDPAGPVPGTET